LALPADEHEKAEKKEEKAVIGAVSRQKSSKIEMIRVPDFTPKMKAQVVKVLSNLIAQEFYRKEQ
jgi:hypothetical protein